MKIDLTKKVDDVVSILSIEENRDDLWPGEYPHILTMEAEYTNWYMLQKKGQKLCISIYEGEDCVVAMSLDAKQINSYIVPYIRTLHIGFLYSLLELSASIFSFSISLEILI